MRRRCLLETLQVIRLRDQYVRRAALSRAIQRERLAARHHQLACEQTALREGQVGEGQQQAAALLRTGQCTAAQGQHWADWQHSARQSLQGARDDARRALDDLRAKRNATRSEQSALGRCSIALDQVRRRLAQQALLRSFHTDNQEQEALEDLSLHRRLSRFRPRSHSRP